MIEEFVKLIPDELKHKSGSVFYSGRNAFSGKKDLYVLGLNPGGSDKMKQKDETLAWHTEKVLTEKNPNWSEYKDGSWLDNKPGTHGLQPRIIHLLEQLNLSPHETPSSNLVFVRSPRLKDISKRFNGYAELCWPFHEAVIKELGIKVVLCFGKSVGRIVKQKLGAKVFVSEFIENNNRKWKTQVFKNSLGQIVIVATHPSIANWTTPNTDPSKLIKSFLIE